MENYSCVVLSCFVRFFVSLHTQTYVNTSIPFIVSGLFVLEKWIFPIPFFGLFTLCMCVFHCFANVGSIYSCCRQWFVWTAAYTFHSSKQYLICKSNFYGWLFLSFLFFAWFMHKFIISRNGFLVDACQIYVWKLFCNRKEYFAFFFTQFVIFFKFSLIFSFKNSVFLWKFSISIVLN